MNWFDSVLNIVRNKTSFGLSLFHIFILGIIATSGSQSFTYLDTLSLFYLLCFFNNKINIYFILIQLKAYKIIDYIILDVIT